MVIADGTLLLIQQGVAVWSRPEGLASVGTALFLDLPTRQELDDARPPSAQPSMLERFQQLIRSAKVGNDRWDVCKGGVLGGG